MNRSTCLILVVLQLICASVPRTVLAEEGDWEITPASEQALDRGLEWLAANQGTAGNWGSNDLGLVSMGLLAFLAEGHMPGRGKYGDTTDRALNYILRHAQPSGLLDISGQQMYNHGLTTFVLGQVYGMTGDPRISPVLDKALKLIANTQCEDGGWGYKAFAQPKGHDLSLAVMQAKALRSAMDSGLEVPSDVIDLAIKDVRNHYSPQGVGRHETEEKQRSVPGGFTYSGGGGGTIAMNAAGVVCMQEFGQYDDWRIDKNMANIAAAIKKIPKKNSNAHLPMDPYTLYYVGQAIYQRGDALSASGHGRFWKDNYPRLRDNLVKSQYDKASDKKYHGKWVSTKHKTGQVGDMWATATACFVLAMPNRYLPILQEGKIEKFRGSRKTR